MTDKFFEKKSIGLLILAGGRSHRMGRDKAGLAMAGGTFAGNIRTAMGDFEEKFFSHDRDFYGNQMTLEGFETLTDEKELKGKGPAAGIVTALKVCRSRWLMVVPCDSPMIDRRAAVGLGHARKQRDISMTARGSRGTEPLVGIYPKKAEPQMRQMLLAGTYRMRDILEQIGYETVRIDDEKLVNINTPEDYKEMIGKK